VYRHRHYPASIYEEYGRQTDTVSLSVTQPASWKGLPSAPPDNRLSHNTSERKLHEKLISSDNNEHRPQHGVAAMQVLGLTYVFIMVA